MTNAEAEARAKLIRFTDTKLAATWLATDRQKPEGEQERFELVTLRGWLMDELEKRMSERDLADARTPPIGRFERWILGGGNPAAYLR